jgi:hypothetical protein
LCYAVLTVSLTVSLLPLLYTLQLQLDGSSDAPTANGHHDDDEGGVTDAAASGDEQQQQQQQQGGAVHSANGYDYDGGGDSPHRHTGKPAAVTSSTYTLLQCHY